jgi:CheY-like chemotaxis protein
MGHDVREARNGQEAVDIAGAAPLDAVLLDIGMPGLNGYEVARRLRQDAAPAKLKLIAVTGFGQDADRRQSQSAGFDHHLVKPFDPEELETILAGLE